MTAPLFALPAALSTGKALFCAWCTLPEPAIAGILAREPGFGAVALDLQHGAVDYAAAARAIPLIAAGGKPAVARIPVGDFATASRLLDAGAAAIIAPMIEGAADARRFVQAVKYVPVGARSWGPTLAVNLGGLDPAGYFAAANRGTCAFAMIETREALAQIDDILAIDGIDGIFVGPADLSIALSGGKLDLASAELEQAIDRIAARARAAGKAPCIFAPNGERARAFAGRGYALIAVGSDIAMLKAGAGAMARAAGG